MRKVISLLIICMMMLVCSGCGNKISSSINLSDEQTKVFATLSHKDTFISTIVDEMESYSSANNIKLDIEEADNDLETQVSQVKEAKEMFKTFLKLNKHYDCVICNNDEMALGVIEAMEEENIDPSSVPIFGVDAIPNACKAILDGKMVFTMKQSGKGQGECAIKAAEALKNGEDIKSLEYSDASGKYIWYPYSAVDKNNASEYIQ